MSKFTSGPWKVCEDGVSVHAPKKDVVVMVPYTCESNQPNFGPHSSAEEEANARLIAAAPELLQALDGLLSEVANAADWENQYFQAIKTKRINAAKKAITKAKGRTKF